MFASCQSEGESSWPLAQGAPDHTFCTHLPHNPRAMTLLMRCPCIYQMSEDTRGVMIAAKSSRKGPQKALAAVQSARSRRQVCINPISPACTPEPLFMRLADQPSFSERRQHENLAKRAHRGR